MQTRRSFLEIGGLALAALTAPDRVRAAAWLLAGRLAPAVGPSPGVASSSRIVEIAMRSDALGTEVWFDPIGVLVEPGTTVRWVLAESAHSTTAYHPANADHSLRIPEGAKPWDSGILTRPGETFEVTLTLPGVYDYYCIPHELAGMVGRIVVGAPGGPGALPFDDFEGRPGTEGWRAVPEAARRTFPPVDEIMRRRIVRRERRQPRSRERTER